jgi:hypothetical protein
MRNKVSQLAVGLFSVLAVAVPTAHAQDSDNSILLGGIQLELGMSQEDVLRKLGVVYSITHWESSPGNWVVTRRGGPIIGQVFFKTEKLTGVNKQWGADDDETAGAFARALREAVESVTRGEVRNCMISTATESTSDGWRTTIDCGRHRLWVLAPGLGANVAGHNIAPSIVENLTVRR